jgi:type II secretory pathway component PulF
MTWALVAVLAIAADLFARAWRTRRRLDFRADFLDLLAGGCRRAAPLPRLLEAAAASHGRREAAWLRDVARRLGDGEPLVGALAALPRRVVPEASLAVLRAAEGTPRFAVALEGAAGDAAEALALRHRVLLGALYPLILVVGGVALHSVTAGASGDDGPLRFVPFRSLDVGVAVALLASAAGGIAASRVLVRLRWVPGTRRLAAARLLRAGALLVDAGLPVGEAMRRAAAAAPAGRARRDALAAAAAVDGGAHPEALWGPLVTSGADRLRLAAAGPRLAAVLRDVAEAALSRWRARVEGWLAWMHPVAILLVGAVVFVDVRFVIGVIENARVVRLW